MEQKIKEIVATFIKVPVEQIGPATPIGRSAMQSSILLHRMYARLAEEGFAFGNYAAIKVFGELSPSGQGSSVNGNGVEVARPVAVNAGGGTLPAEIGIDIEEVAAMPRTADFRREEFYKMNFSAGEIAYCILQPDPYASFAGLFAAKEAIIKADGSNRDKVFNTLEIGHSPEGKPLHPDYGISISHAGGMVVAVAARLAANATLSALSVNPSLPAASTGKSAGSGSWIAWLALLLSLTAFLLALFH